MRDTLKRQCFQEPILQSHKGGKISRALIRGEMYSTYIFLRNPEPSFAYVQFWSAVSRPSDRPFLSFFLLPLTAVLHLHLSLTHFWSNSFGFALLSLPLICNLLLHKNKLPQGGCGSNASTYLHNKIIKRWADHSACHCSKTSNPASPPGQRLSTVSAPQLPVNHCAQLTELVCLNSTAKWKASAPSMWTPPGEIFCQ